MEATQTRGSSHVRLNTEGDGWINLVVGPALVSSLESPTPTHPLEWGSANYSLQATSGLLPVFTNSFIGKELHSFMDVPSTLLWRLNGRVE